MLGQHTKQHNTENSKAPPSNQQGIEVNKIAIAQEI